MRRNPIREDEQSFVDEVATLFASWGLPPSSGRVYGYLLLCEGPVSVDQIAAALLMSRTGAWNSARVLERFGHISRYGAPGSKRALYAASDNFAVPFLEQAALIEKAGNLMQTCASTIANAQAALRLGNRARFWLSIRDAIRAAIEHFAAPAASTLRPRSTLQKGRKKA